MTAPQKPGAVAVGSATETSFLFEADWPYRLVQSMPAGAMVVTPDGRVLWSNPRMAALLRTTSQLLQGASAASLVAEVSQGPLRQLLSADPPNAQPVELTFRDEDGTGFAATVTASGLDFDDERAVCLLVTDTVCPKATAEKLAITERWFQTLVQNNSELIAVLDETGHLMYANPAAERTLGLSVAEQPGLNVLDLVHPDDRARAGAALSRDLSGPGLQPPSTYRFGTVSGSWRVLEVQATNCLDDPAIAGVVVNARDITDLESSEERFRVLAEAAPIGIVESLRGEMTYANPRAAEICGVSVRALLEGAWTDALHPDDVAGAVAFFDRARPTGAIVTTTFRIRRPGGEVRHVRVCAAPRAQGPDSGRVTTISDITEEVEAQERLAHHALYDALTDLPNRNLFLDRLAQELAPHRGDEPNIAVLCLDLDRFKVVNDSLGHDAGDEVLKKTATRLRRALRAGETVARLGGDEFVLIIRDVRQVADAVSAAKRLMSVVQSPLRSRGQNLTVTGSIGVVVPGPNADGATVVRDAESAMYRAKEAGRDRYEVFNEDLHHRSVERLALESDLRRALKRRQFELYYQGAVALPSGRPMGAEALIRWHHPKRGVVAPLEFIPVAEDSGMIKAIGAWVFEQAVAQLAWWDAEVDGPRLEVLAVNLSARQLDDRDTSDMVRDVLERYRVAPARISVELTESAVMAENGSTKLALQALRELGLRVSIDDFGTGYSSLAHLHTLPVTTLKIDRSFVERLGSADDSAPVVQAVIDMGHAMGLRVIAEGVSSEHLSARLSSMGCDVAQGFYWSRPLPMDEFTSWWREAERGAVASPGAP